MRRRGATACAVIALAVMAFACASGSSGRALTDHEIAMVVRAANDGEVQQAQAALSRLSDAHVRAFAEMMVREHSSANDRAAAFFQSRNLVPAESAASRELQSRAERESQELSTVGASMLDAAYVDTQIRMHREVLKQIDESLYPAARDLQLRDFLTQMRVSVAQHIAEAEQIRRGLAK